jgi:MarR family transcriptional regulator for hemolysin
LSTAGRKNTLAANERTGAGHYRKLACDTAAVTAPPMDKFQDLGFRLDEVARLYTKRFEERAQTLSLRLGHCKVLILLAENEGVSQARLSRISAIDPARLVVILDRLEAEGWAQRRRRPGDRRMRSLAITENAEPIIRLIWSVVSDTYIEALQGLSTDEIGTMMKVLEGVHSNLLAGKPLGPRPADTVRNNVTGRRRLRLVR